MTTAAGPTAAVAAAAAPRQGLDLMPQRDVLERQLASFPGGRRQRRERVSEEPATSTPPATLEASIAVSITSNGTRIHQWHCTGGDADLESLHD
jgi:hypothetical protein